MPPGFDQAFPAFVTLTNAITMICSLALFEYPQFHYPQKPEKKNFYLFLFKNRSKI